MEKTTPLGISSFVTLRTEEEMKSTLNSVAKTPDLSPLLHMLRSSGKAYFVGGIVRDALLGKPIKDIDVATSLLPQELEELLHASNFRVIETGLEHGTVTVLAGENPVEVTTFRSPSKRAETKFGRSIEEDLSGRDFTFNAMAVCVESGEFIDPFGGSQDLQQRICRAVGDASERFQEDPHRLLRMLRFGPAEGRLLSEDTIDGARGHISALAGVAPERIREELLHILIAPFPHQAMKVCHELGLLEVVLPELVPSVGCEQNEWHIHDVFEHTLWVLERSAEDYLVRFASLFHDIGKPHTVTIDDSGRRHFYKHELIGAEIAEQIMTRLRFSKADTRAVTKLVREHMRPLECGPSGVRRIMRDLGEHFDQWLLLKQADAPPVMPEDEFQAMYHRFMQMVSDEQLRQEGPAYGRLAINGSDLIAAGFAEGPEIGRILSQCEELVIEDPEQNSRENLLSVANSFRQRGGQ
jgi:tRNA nucleotidyltransferase (CCA-adding enzyme)